MTRADVIVVGLGAMGSATAYQLARRGVRVLGIDRHRPPHGLGSTLGESRVTRVATAEGAQYVPLARRSHELWRELEQEAGEDVFTACGVLMVGPRSGGQGLHGLDDWLGRTIELAERFGVEHELLDGATASERWPALAIEPEFRAYLEPGAGFVRPEAAVRAQLQLAAGHGAELRLDTIVTGIRAAGDGVVVTTASGELCAAHAIVSAGAWAPDFLAAPELRALLHVERQVLHWFEVDPALAAHATPDELPVYFWASDDRPFYGFPMLGGIADGIKAATDQSVPATSPELVDRSTTRSEAHEVFDTCLDGRLLAARREPVRSTACMYTVTPDRHFVIDAHPELEHVTLVSPCSGHGFKHSAAIGEALAQRVLEGSSTIDLAPFALARLLAATPP
jgi:sarcosine oxidase